MRRLKSPKIHLLILENSHLSPEALSGGDIVFEKMYQHLRMDLNVTIIVPEMGKNHWRKFKNIQIKSLPRNVFEKLINYKFGITLVYIWRSIQAFLYILKLKFDFVYSSTNSLPDILPIFLFKLLRPKVIWISRIHHLILVPSKRKGNFFINTLAYGVQILTLYLLKKSNLIIILNKSPIQILSKYGIPKNKIEVVHAGVDFKYYHAINNLSDFDCLFLGRLHESKGIFDLPYIWQQVNMILPDAKLAVIGEANQKIIRRLKAATAVYGVENNIHILGFLSQKRVLKTLKKSKLFIFTDYEGGFSLAVAEAMASGLPVVGYNLPIFGDVYKKGYITVPLGDKNAMAKAIVKLLQNPRKMKQLSFQAVSQAKKLDWSISAKQFIKIIRLRFINENS